MICTAAIRLGLQFQHLAHNRPQINIKLDFALLDEVYLLGKVLLMIQNISLLKAQRLQLNHNRHKEVLILILEEMDTVDYHSVGTCNNL